MLLLMSRKMGVSINCLAPCIRYTFNLRLHTICIYMNIFNFAPGGLYIMVIHNVISIKMRSECTYSHV